MDIGPEAALTGQQPTNNKQQELSCKGQKLTALLLQEAAHKQRGQVPLSKWATATGLLFHPRTAENVLSVAANILMIFVPDV
jgi:hypothetical protein